jgi:hypothetical protein
VPQAVGIDGLEQLRVVDRELGVSGGGAAARLTVLQQGTATGEGGHTS